ncbi:zinc finger protein 16-like isoform X2 [Haplochromis burtoni]|uniref:zinc finger protein 16-like isoform X2 n=1 Tax=Haplochromis burtoni TaxID=8153 RepID=UPI001C2D44F6|nr:zinc finger protein 16-like isoform X2 [Haplochromis burtoni]
MNGAVYMSFFQGQLESVLEQVVQLAVQEISKTVGSSLNGLLLETAVKEQENRRLGLQLQAREKRGRASASDDGGGGSPVADQLKSVMEHVLDFAVRELTKIVEASFDDLLLEITKMEREQQLLEKRLGKGAERGGGDKGKGGGRGRRGSENDSVSPSGSEDAREEVAVVTASKETPQTHVPERPPVLSVSQDWVPILDKVFGQKWCSDVWNVKEVGGGGGGGSGRGLGESVTHIVPAPTPAVTLEPSPSSPQQDPRWTPLEDMEVFSPDEDEAAGSLISAAAAVRPPPGPPPGPPLSPTCQRSSASMLHRLLTLPSQLLDDDEEATAKETLGCLAFDGSIRPQDAVELPAQTGREEEEEEGEEEDEEDKGMKRKRRRVWSECEECGRRFSRIALLKAHRQTHSAGNAATSSPSSPPAGAASPLRCSDCGKRFSSATRLHSHIRTQHHSDQS